LKKIVRKSTKTFACLMLLIFSFLLISNVFASDRVVNLVVGYKTINMVFNRVESFIINLNRAKLEHIGIKHMTPSIC
jgi:hypothetical protein